MIANRRYVVEAVAEFNRLDADALSLRLRPVPAKNLAVLRDAVRAFARFDNDDLFSDEMIAYVVSAITAEIDRRWS